MEFHVVSDPDSFQSGICLLKDNWDDWFSYETSYRVYYVSQRRQSIYIGFVKIGQKGLKESGKTSPGYRSPDLMPHFSKLPPGFFSLGQEDDYYINIKKIDEKITKGFRKKYLEAMNDVAYNLTLFSLFESERVMQVSLLRSVSRPMVIDQFNRIAKGGETLTKYSFGYRLDTGGRSDVRPADLAIEVNPGSNPATNIHVVIGRNGVGKTHLIKSLINSTFKVAGYREKGYCFDLENHTEIDPLDLFSNLICIGFSAFDDLPREMAQLDEMDESRYVFIGLDHVTAHQGRPIRSDDGSDNDSNKRRLRLISASFWDRVNSIMKSNAKRDLMNEAIECLSYDDLFQDNIRDIIPEDYLLNQKDAHPSVSLLQKRAFRRLSSGHKIALLTVTCLVDAVVEKSLVVLDEPETHLHPPLLSALLQAISSILIRKNGVALVMTHSPIVLQEVPSSCVWQMRRYGHQVLLQRVKLETFGTDINTLMREVFGYEILKTGFHRTLIDVLAAEDGDFDNALARFQGELGNEGVALLKALSLGAKGGKQR